MSSTKKTSFDTTKELFTYRGYTLLTTIDEYNYMKLSKDKIKFVCPNGHIHKMLLGNFKSGQNCGLCDPRIAGVTWNDVIELFENKKGWKVLSIQSEFRSALHDKIIFQCKEGHIHQYTYTALKRRNSECPHCIKVVPITFSEIKESMESEGYIVHTTEEEFKTQSITRIKFVCPKGHKSQITGRKWRMGRRCSKCSVSKEEYQIREFLDEQGISYEMNDRSTIKNPKTGHYLELDLWFPDKYKAIEHNGVYRHSMSDRIEKDIIKLAEAQKINLPILIIMDYEWNKNKEVTKERILKFLESN